MAIIGSAILKYLHGIGKDTNEASRIINLTKEIELLNKCADVGVLDHVKDLRAFVRGLVVLKEKPFAKLDFGEDIDNAYTVRIGLSKCLDIQDEEKSLDFAAWALWQKHKSKMYISASVTYGYCHRLKLNPKGLFKYVHRHSIKTNLVTHIDLHSCERAISSFMAGAVVLQLRVPTSSGLDQRQNGAIAHTLNSAVSAIQGSAGCGKTTSVSHMVNHICKMANVVCLAFTHKAKRCIKQKLNNEDVHVSTIHSFIQSTRTGPPLSGLFLMVDETSMLDIELLAELCLTVKTKCDNYQVCFVGDDQQLPPIGRGEFFRQFVSHGVGVSRLDKCYRTDRPDLFAAFESIRAGKMPVGSENFNVLLETNNINSRVGTLINSGSADTDDVQFIAWQNKDVFKINQWMQTRRHKIGRIGPESWRGFYKHDRVIYKGENKDGLTNAIIGRVTDVPSTGGINVRWEDDTITLFKKDISQVLFLGYCFTAHSSQGSEYGTVIIPVYDVDKMTKCMDRRWFYTAVTRAKSKAIVITTPGINNYLGNPLAPLPLSDIRMQFKAE